MHAWQQVTDPQEVTAIGRDLAKVVAAILGEGSDVDRFVRERISQYEA